MDTVPAPSDNLAISFPHPDRARITFAWYCIIFLNINRSFLQIEVTLPILGILTDPLLVALMHTHRHFPRNTSVTGAGTALYSETVMLVGALPVDRTASYRDAGGLSRAPFQDLFFTYVASVKQVRTVIVHLESSVLSMLVATLLVLNRRSSDWKRRLRREFIATRLALFADFRPHIGLRNLLRLAYHL